ncbi:MAG: CshA/CshB family fibrillar adhesin-related protein [Bifidobacteriaceae bacterium]|jgi:uncharacterized repeat protein (TIGR01451 family)|nr:CshA/CshB family fibrillar adhesin-related protein [Bifidobacteriaceae bacterium]
MEGPARKTAAVLAAASLALAGLVLVGEPKPAEAVFATGGDGHYPGLIDWFDWGDTASIPEGTYTNERKVGESVITTACTISKTTSALKPYRPGSFTGDGLDNLYNIGGTDKNNTMYIGIGNVLTNQAVEFDFSCEMSVDDGIYVTKVAIPGLVIADAESSKDEKNEYIQAKPANSDTVWRLIDIYRAEGCTSSLKANLKEDGTLRVVPSKQCQDGSPTAVTFMDGSAAARISILGSNTTAIALGVVSYMDYADGPAAYGAAGAFGFPTWSGGKIPSGDSDLMDMAAPELLATVDQPGVRLGHRTDGESAPPFSANATGDDTNAKDNDEDLAVPKTITGYRGGMVVIKDLICAGPGRVYGWIDFNRNNVFDPPEADGDTEMGGPVPASGESFVSQAIDCGQPDDVERTFSMAWKVPKDAQPTPAGQLTMVRIGITTDERVVDTPVGVAINGELEDHAVDFLLDPYTVAKTSDADHELRSGKVVTYEIVITTPKAEDASTPPASITVRDDLTEVLKNATLNKLSYDDGGLGGAFTFLEDEKELSWTGPPPPPDTSATLKYSVTLTSAGQNFTNVAWVDNPAAEEEVTCKVDTASGSGRDPDTDEPCALYSFDTPQLVLEKSSTQKTSDRAGASVLYTVKATNTGPGDFTSTQPAVVMDDLSGLLNTADGPGNVTYVGDLKADRPGDMTQPDKTTQSPPLISWTGVLAKGESVTLTYSVTLRSTGSGLLRNVAWQPEDPNDPEPPDCDGDADTTGLDPTSLEVCLAHEFYQPKVQITKSMATNPAPPVYPGTKLIYTVEATNVGQADFGANKPLVLADDLTDVLDGSEPGVENLAASIGGNAVNPPSFDAATGHIYWVGELPAGETVVMTYTLTLAGHGNGASSNVAWAPRGQTTPGATPPPKPADCPSVNGAAAIDPKTEEPCAALGNTRALLALSKTTTTDSTLGPVPGSQVTYTITGANNGLADYTEGNPAIIWDDLSGVLAGAAWGADATATVDGQATEDQPTLEGSILKWQGALPQGKAVVITYTVTLLSTGPATLRNVAWVPRAADGQVPDCDQPPGTADDPDSHEVCAANSLARPLLKVTKAIVDDGQGSVTTDFRAGDRVHYVVTATNVGAIPFQQGGPALVRDNLSGTLDDATGPAHLSASPDTAPAPTFNTDSGNISWSGVLAPAASVTIEYDVTLKNGGDATAPDVAWAPADRASPTPPACLNTSNSGPPNYVVSDAVSHDPCARVALAIPAVSITKTVTKTVNPNQAVSVGDLVDFTVTFKNTGATDYSTDRPLEVVDSLAATLAEGDLVVPPTVDPASAQADGYFVWPADAAQWRYYGPLPVGGAVTVTYQVKLTSRGDGQLRNIAYEPLPGQQTAPTCSNAADGIDQATGAACAAAELKFPVLRIAKTSDIKSSVSSGDPITYRITITNVSPADFPGAVVMDDISDVLSGATWTPGAQPVVSGYGTAAFDEQKEMITWQGDLPAGQRAVIEYQVTAGQSATDELANVAWQPANPQDPQGPETPKCDPAPGGVDQDSGEPCARVASPTRAVELTKEVAFPDSDGGPPVPGDRAVYTITAENTSEVDYGQDSQLVLHDDLSQLLQAASLDTDSLDQAWETATADDKGEFEVSGAHLIWRGSLLVGQTVTLTYEAVLGPGGPGSVRNVVWEPAEPYDPDPDPPACVNAFGAYVNGASFRDAAFAEACSSTGFTRPVLTITKVAEAAEAGKEGPLVTGDLVKYTITLHNSGAANFTSAAPARLADSLAAMADGAVYQDNAAVAYQKDEADTNSTITYDSVSKTLNWSGPLQAGHEATITYTARLVGTGPAALVNTAWVPSNPVQESPPAVCPRVTPGEPTLCAQVTVPRALMHIEKTQQAPQSPRAGDKVYYTIILRNIGTAAYAGDGGWDTYAHLFDDLRGLLNNADYDKDSWRVVDDGGIPTGTATWNEEDQRLEWYGPLAPGAGVTATFSVTLTGQGSGRISNLTWSPTDPDQEMPTCAPISDVPDPGSTGRCAMTVLERTQVEVEKALVEPVPEVPRTGSVIKYQITIKNTGEADFTAERPAVLLDDLTDVLASAIYQWDAKAVYADDADKKINAPVYTNQRLSWRGPLEAGQAVTLTYSVRLIASAQPSLRNVAWSPSDPFNPFPSEPPTCPADEADTEEGEKGTDPVSKQPCSAVTLARALGTFEKSVSLKTASGQTVPLDGPALPGDTLTYSITIKNSSEVAFTEDYPATIWDDMAEAQPDAIYQPGSLKATLNGTDNEAEGTASDKYYDYDDGEARLYKLYWSGPLKPGDYVTLSYDVLVNADGDGLFRNVAWAPRATDGGEPASATPSAPSCSGSDDGQPVRSVSTGELCAGLNVTGPALSVRKWSSPAGVLLPGQVVTYTIEASNTGAADYTEERPMEVVDDLSGLLDDASYVEGSAKATLRGKSTQLEDPTVSLTADAATLSWSGAVAAGDLVEITYKVKLLGSGNGQADNLVWGPLPDLIDPDQDRGQPTCQSPLGGQFDPGTGQACATDSRALPKLSLLKEISAGPYALGREAQYTLTIANKSAADFTAGHPAVVFDDLSGVLDGAVLNNYEVSSVTGQTERGTLSYLETGQMLRWSGPLVAQAVVKITYSVTWLATGDGLLRNVAWQPTDPSNPVAPDKCEPTGEICSEVSIARPLLSVSKASNGLGESLRPGDQVTYTVTAKNTGQADYLAPGAPAVVVDNVRPLLVGAVFDAGSAQAEVFEANGALVQAGDGQLDYDATTGLLRWEGSLGQGQSVAITFAITLTGGGNGADRNVAWSPLDPTDHNPPPPACSDESNGGLDRVTGEPCATDSLIRPSLTVAKWSDAENPRPGDTVTYTVQVSNVSLVDFTKDNPAIVYDNLSDVIKEADFAGLADVTVSPAAAAADGQLVYQEPLLSWTGALASGETVVLAIKVVLNDGGDGIVRNVAWRPNDPTEIDPPACQQTDSITDSETQEPCAVDEFATRALRLTKTATPSDPMPGSVVKYTLTVENTGGLAFTATNPAWVVDDLSSTLATSQLSRGPEADTGYVETAGLKDTANPWFGWHGALEPDEVATVTYEVTLGLTMAATRSSNTAWVPNDPAKPAVPKCDATDKFGADETTGEPCAKVTLTPPVLTITKTSTVSRPGMADPPAYPRPGDTITYTLTVVNNGTGAYTDTHPAVVVDALDGVLDDADWDGSQKATSGNLLWTPIGSAGRLAWWGELAPNGGAGSTAVITYSVTVKAGGDGQMNNVVWVPNSSDPNAPGQPPACDPDKPGGNWLACDDVPIPALRIDKTMVASPDTGLLQAGVRLTYTLALTNTGQGAFTDMVPAHLRDDLSEVLDDAVWVDYEAPEGWTVAWEEPYLTGYGPLGAGQTVELSYSVDLIAGGDGDMRNLAWSPANPAAEEPEPPSCAYVTELGVDLFSEEPCAMVDCQRPILNLVSKTADPPSGAAAGELVTYTLVASNTGATAFTLAEPARISDSLANVLDDAEPFDLVSASDGGAGGTFTYSEPILSWQGPIEVGATVTLTYQVKVTPGGDGDLRNVAWVPIGPDTADPTPPDCQAAESGSGSGSGPECAATDTPVPSLSVDKSVEVTPPMYVGSVVTYTIELANVGQADFVAGREGFMADDMTDALDDAEWVGDASATVGTVEFEAPRLVWAGTLKMGQSAVITYTMRLTGRGDGAARNLAWVTGSEDEAWFAVPPQVCSGSACSSVDVPEPLPVPTPTPTPSPTSPAPTAPAPTAPAPPAPTASGGSDALPQTGAGGIALFVWAALAAVGSGAALAQWGRRRRLAGPRHR